MTTPDTKANTLRLVVDHLLDNLAPHIHPVDRDVILDVLRSECSAAWADGWTAGFGELRADIAAANPYSRPE